MEENPEERLLSFLARFLFVKLSIEVASFFYITWEERGGFMSGGTYISEIRRFLILHTVSLI